MILPFLTTILLLITIIGFLRWAWWFTIADFFRLQYAAVAVLLLLVSIWYGDLAAVAVNSFSFAVNMFRIRHFMPRFSPGGIYQDKNILSVNAYKDNHNPKELKRIIEGAKPELMLIMEMTDRMEEALGEALNPYSHKLETDMRDDFAMCLLSKTPFISTEVTYHGPSKTPLLRATLLIDDEEWTVFSAHPKPALNKAWHEERGVYFHEVEQIISAVGKDKCARVMVLGDFNSVPWEIHFRKFLHNTNLKSTLEGKGYHITWPVFFPILGIPMDHILISKNQTYKDLHIGPYAGSDHYPVSLNL